MFHALLKNKAFKSKIRGFFQENKADVLDIILIGSTVRGKESPQDIDILLLFKDKEDLECAYTVRKELEKLGLKKTFNILTKTYRSLISETFLAKEAFLSEGYSLITNKFVSEELGYHTFILFKYELKGFTQSQRMQFQYSLYGRKNQGGMLKKLSLIKFSDMILLSPVPHAEKTKEYLLFWNIKFEEMPILLPSRIV